MTYLRTACVVAAALGILTPFHEALSAQRDGGGKPSLSLRLTPPVGFTPMRMRAAVELRGCSNDYPDFYCASVEWDWGDGTMSESASDCAPYEAGKSVIVRNYSAEHTYRQAGTYRVVFKLKQKTRQVAAANATVTVRGGAGDQFGG
jgi:hypothetical protein